MSNLQLTYTRNALAAYIDCIHAYETTLEDSEVAPQLQTSSHGRIELRRQLALQLVKQPGYKAPQSALMHMVDKEMGLGSLWRNSRATRGRHLGTLCDLVTMPECEGVFKVEDSKEPGNKVILLNTSKLAEVGTAKMMDLVDNQWPHDVNMTCWTQHFVVSSLVHAQLERSTCPDAAPFTLALPPLEQALMKQWPRGSRWEDENVEPKPYEGTLAECLMRDNADRYLTISKAQDGTEMVTFLPANLAEDMHDTESMILKYEQGGLLARTNAPDNGNGSIDSRKQSIIAANAAVLEQQQAAVRSGIGRNKHGTSTKDEKRKNGWSHGGFGEEEPPRAQANGHAAAAGPPCGNTQRGPQPMGSQELQMSDEELARALQEQLDAEDYASRRAGSGGSWAAAAGARSAGAAPTASTSTSLNANASAWPSLPSAGSGSVPTAKAGKASPAPPPPASSATDSATNHGANKPPEGLAPRSTPTPSLDVTPPVPDQQQPTSQDKVSPRSKARPTSQVYVPPHQRAAAAAAAAAAAQSSQTPSSQQQQAPTPPPSAPTPTLPTPSSTAPPAAAPSHPPPPHAQSRLPGMAPPAAPPPASAPAPQPKPLLPPGMPPPPGLAHAQSAAPPMPTPALSTPASAAHTTQPSHPLLPPGMPPPGMPPPSMAPPPGLAPHPPPGFPPHAPMSAAPMSTPHSPAPVSAAMPMHTPHLQQHALAQAQAAAQLQQVQAMHYAHMVALQAQQAQQAQHAQQAQYARTMQEQQAQQQQQQQEQEGGTKEAEVENLMALLTGSES